MSELLTGRVCVVTGAGSPAGLGRVMAFAMLRAGARVAFLDADADALRQTADDARVGFGVGRSMAIAVDVADPDQVSGAVDEVVRAYGRLDVLVNNAGTNVRSFGVPDRTDFWRIPSLAWERVTAVNYLGAVMMTNAALPTMLKQSYGRVIGVTTSLDTMWRPISSPGYGPSKAAHEAFVSVAGHTLRGTGVTANVLVPGGITRTNAHHDPTLAATRALLDPQIMAAPVVWLASEGSASTTATRIIAHRWDETRPIVERLASASAPAAWAELGIQAVERPAES